jgi:DNA-binding FadR family transcriptional regulator
MAERAARGESFPEEDRVFHRALYSTLDNQLLLGLLEIFWDVYQRLLAEAVIVPESDPVSSWEGHRRIVEALERHDEAAARAAMAAHFAGVKRRVQDARLRAGPDAHAGADVRAGPHDERPVGQATGSR